ncbi:MAG: hypothetical protein KC468_27095, partial [Myxococcales bacterium]|nr:hypothetical protein [Myxococcales bacterium]
LACGDAGGDTDVSASGTGTDSSNSDATGSATDATATETDASAGPSPSGTGDDSATGTTHASGTEGTTDPLTATDGTATDTTGDDNCEGGILCGQPAMCCEAGNECVQGACLPTCESEVRCGPNLELCCDEGDVCLADACATPGEPCEDSYDCPVDQFCEPTLEQCLPQPDPVECTYVPDFEELEVALEWSWEDAEIISPPVVVDITGDGVPEVVINSGREGGGDWPIGQIYALDGQTGSLLWTIPHNPGNNQYGSHGRSSIAAGDVDGDGTADIVYAGRAGGNGRSPVHAVNGAGGLLWTSYLPGNQVATTTVVNGAASLANLDDDPEAEVVFGAAVFDHDGLMVWDEGGNGGALGTSNGYTGGITAIADLDDDDIPELVSGHDAFKINWQPGNPPTVSLELLWTSNAGPDGYPAIADLDNNGSPEVVIIGSGTLQVVDGATGQLWCGADPSGVLCQNNNGARTQPRAIPGGGRGGPPTISDFDGDGKPEVGIAGASRYVVFDFNRPGEDIVKPGGEPDPVAGATYVRWSSVTQDQSSNATGSSVFDFQGDGAAEVVYADECFMRVYSGVDGTVQLQLQNSSATIHEYPLVVDVDADGNSEILVVANLGGQCGNVPNYQDRKGVFVYGDAGNGWVPTRRVWNQHAYHVTNTTGSGVTPLVELDNWLQPGLNNYRQNVQGNGVFNAPDLTVELALGLDKCLDDTLVLIATVYNKGALGVTPGIDVTFYEGVDATGVELGTVATQVGLLPGASTKVTLEVPAPPPDMTASYYVEVDHASEGDGAILECNEDNNDSLVTDGACPDIG